MSDKEATTEAKSATKDTQVSSNVQFPFRLHEMLDEVDSSIISWVPSSNAFKVHDKVTFTEKTLPQYFNATKYKSFQRNCELYTDDLCELTYGALCCNQLTNLLSIALRIPLQCYSEPMGISNHPGRTQQGGVLPSPLHQG